MAATLPSTSAVSATRLLSMELLTEVTGPKPSEAHTSAMSSEHMTRASFSASSATARRTSKLVTEGNLPQRSNYLEGKRVLHSENGAAPSVPLTADGDERLSGEVVRPGEYVRVERLHPLRQVREVLAHQRRA